MGCPDNQLVASHYLSRVWVQKIDDRPSSQFFLGLENINLTIKKENALRAYSGVIPMVAFVSRLELVLPTCSEGVAVGIN